jgi:hypothetical protein
MGQNSSSMHTQILKERNDWAYIHVEEFKSSGEAIETYYPSKILGFVTIH